MKIAVATEGNRVSEHFGRCENFTVAEVENSGLKSKIVVNTLGNQHGLLPGFLASQDIDVVIAGGMGEGAKQNLISNGIEIISGVSGNVDEAIDAYLRGGLESGDAGCSGHEHSHEDNHGEGGCSCGCH